MPTMSHGGPWAMDVCRIRQAKRQPLETVKSTQGYMVNRSVNKLSAKF